MKVRSPAGRYPPWRAKAPPDSRRCGTLGIGLSPFPVKAMDDLAPARCNFCDAEVPRKDFQEGRAVTVAGRNYCRACMTVAIERGKNPDRPPELRTPRPARLPVPQDRRRHERKDTVLFLELSIYGADGRLHHRAPAVMRNVSLSGALLGGLVMPAKVIPADIQRIGIRLLEGPLRDQEILCRVVRIIPRDEGSDVALEFEGTEAAKVERLRQIV